MFLINIGKISTFVEILYHMDQVCKFGAKISLLITLNFFLDPLIYLFICEMFL